LIVGYTGTALDLSDGRRVYAYHCHGGNNQQWVIHTDGRGGATIQSCIAPHGYVTYHELKLDSQLVLVHSRFTWEMSKDGDGYRFSVPGTNFALSLGACARIRYLHEQPGTCIYLKDISPRNTAALQSGSVSSSTIQPKSQKLESLHTSEDSKVHTPPDHSEESDRLPIPSEGNKSAEPSHSRRPKFGKKSRNTTGRGSSSSKDCTVQ
jgi:hypothetical protein